MGAHTDQLKNKTNLSISNRKTLVVIDTCILRKSDGDALTYDNCVLSKDFEELSKYVKQNNLFKVVELLVPNIIFDEINLQKTQQYENDTKIFPKLVKRLKAIHTELNELDIQGKEIEIKKQTENFLKTRGVVIFGIENDKKGMLFDSLYQRALLGTAPFKKTEKHSDFGFKDAVFWETTKEYLSQNEFFDLIILTRDNYLAQIPENELAQICGGQVKFLATIDQVKNELENNHVEYIKTNTALKYIYSEYFFNRLVEELKLEKLNPEQVSYRCDFAPLYEDLDEYFTFDDNLPKPDDLSNYAIIYVDIIDSDKYQGAIILLDIESKSIVNWQIKERFDEN